MALATLLNPFLLRSSLKETHPHPFLSSGRTTSSSSPFQCHANSPTNPTISMITHLPVSPNLICKRALSCPILCALPEDDRGQENDEIPAILNDGEWGGGDPKSRVTDPRNVYSFSFENSNDTVGDESEKRAPASTYLNEWGEKTNPEDGWSNTKLSDADPPTLDDDDEWGGDPKSRVTDPGNVYSFAFENSNDNVGNESEKRAPASASYVDEWGEKTNPEDGWSDTKLSDADPPTLDDDDEWGGDPKSRVTEPGNVYTFSFENSNDNVGDESEKRVPASASYVDEWGEKTNPEDGWSDTKLSDADPPTLDDDEEWGKQQDGNGSAAISQGSIGVDTSSSDSKLAELKRCLVDCFYGTEYGLRASSQTRAEIAELISELEVENPTPAPTEALSLLQGKWILVYTSFSELLPLIAAGTLPFVKLGKICQVIDTGASTVENSASYIGPFATFSFRALASFEVCGPKRIQVKFEEGIIPPPEITSNIDIPAKVEILGQKIDISSFKGSVYPLQEATSSIARVISGLPPIKVPIRRDGPQSWLLTTYLDKDLRISRGDGGGLFVLVKEGSSLSSL